MDAAAAIRDFKHGVSALYGGRLRRTLLFGSYARGRPGKESDIDILVVLSDPEVDAISEIARTAPLVTSILLDHAVLIHAIVVSENEYTRGESGLMANVRGEGIEA